MTATPPGDDNALARSVPPPPAEVGARHGPGSRIGRALRRDATANRRRILDVAAVVLREDGREAPVTTLSARSGLGAATIYRHFPSRADLLDALYERAVARHRRALDAVRAEPDVVRRLERLLRLEAAALVDCHDCTEWFALAHPDRYRDHRAALRAVLDGALADARPAGRLQPHVGVDDLLLALDAVDGALRTGAADPATTAQRIVTLVVRGIVSTTN